MVHRCPDSLRTWNTPFGVSIQRSTPQLPQLILLPQLPYTTYQLPYQLNSTGASSIPRLYRSRTKKSLRCFASATTARCPATTATRRCGWACFRCATTRRSLPCIGCGEARGCRRRICCSIHGVGRSSRVGQERGQTHRNKSRVDEEMGDFGSSSREMEMLRTNKP